MLWECCSAAGTGKCGGLERKLNRSNNRDIIEEILSKGTQDLRMGRRFSFEHDNDLKHTAKITKKHLNVTARDWN